MFMDMPEEQNTKTTANTNSEELTLCFLALLLFPQKFTGGQNFTAMIGCIDD